MTDNLRDRIAAVQRRHMWGTAQRCVCGGHREPSTHPEHVADAVIEALGLRPERGQRSNPDGPLWGSNNRHNVTRYVTEWAPDE